MNSAAVSQPPVAAGGTAADRPRNGARQDGLDKQDGGFSRLLSQLANNREQEGSPAVPARTDGAVAGEDAGGSFDVSDAALESKRTVDFVQQSGQQDGGGGVFTDIDVTALMQILSAGGALPGASGLSAIAGRVANGTVTEAETALMQAALAAQQDGDALSPEQLILASLAKASARQGEPENPEVALRMATLTVLRRETHLAPVADAGMAWAARLAVPDNRMAGPATQPGTEDTEDVQLLDTDASLDSSDEAHLANAPVAVTVTRDGPLADWRRSALPMAEVQAGAADLQSGAAGQVATVGRADALVNAGLAPAFTQQIADRVVVEATTPSTQTARPDAPAFGVKHESPMKVMHIQLQPADLGVVTIRMSVKDNALRLDLEVGRGETASLIQRDREALSALLRAAGYVIDGMEVRLADPSGAGAQNGNGQANTPMQGGGQSGSSQTDGRSQGERPHNERDSNAFGHGRNREDEQAGHTARGGVYI